MQPNAEGVCWSCGNKLGAADYTREGECPNCRKQTHVCRNCRFHEVGRPNDCQEPVAEPLTTCSIFEFPMLGRRWIQPLRVHIY